MLCKLSSKSPFYGLLTFPGRRACITPQHGTFHISNSRTILAQMSHSDIDVARVYSEFSWSTPLGSILWASPLWWGTVNECQRLSVTASWNLAHGILPNLPPRSLGLYQCSPAAGGRAWSIFVSGLSLHSLEAGSRQKIAPASLVE